MSAMLVDETSHPSQPGYAESSPISRPEANRHMSATLRNAGAEPNTFWSRFDTRTAMVIASASGALPLLAIALVSPSFLRPGALPLLAAIVVFTTVTVLFAFKVGRLTDKQFAVLGSGGMLGVAISAYLIADPVGVRAVSSMLAVTGIGQARTTSTPSTDRRKGQMDFACFKTSSG